jgi:hypothetical protein
MLRVDGAAPERALEITVDPYIPLMVRDPAAGGHGVSLWWRFRDPRAMLELGFHPGTAALVDVTLVLSGPITRVPSAPPAATERVPGIPCCDPAEWARRAAGGVVEAYRDHHVEDAEPVHTELGPDHLLVRIGDGGTPAAREVTFGRARCGISAGDALLWICVAGFSAEERALLEEHVVRSHVPPGPLPVRDDRPWWRRIIPGG